MSFSFNAQTLSIIAEEFSRLLHQEISPEQVRTSTLLKNDYCVGRKFQVGNIVAIWKNAQPEIEFYDLQTGAAQYAQPGKRLAAVCRVIRRLFKFEFSCIIYLYAYDIHSGNVAVIFFMNINVNSFCRKRAVSICFIGIILFTQLWYAYPILRHPKLHYWAFLNAQAENPQSQGYQSELFFKNLKKAKDQVSFETNIWSNTYTDIYGLTCKVLQKDSCGGIVKLKSGLLTDITSQFDVSKSQGQLITLQETLDKKNIPLLFVLAPYKISPTDSQLPRGVKDVRNEIANQFIDFLKQRHIDYIDCRSIFANNPAEHYRLFLKSDFHWQPEYAFYAFRQTADKLNSQYGFNIPPQYYDPSSYTEKLVPLEERPYRGQNINLELKATGRFFAPIDQFILFEPNFQTNTRFEIPHLNVVKEGNYTQTWRQSGVYAIQKSINYDVHDKKVCLIKDSFGASYFDYLTLSCHELMAIDPRNFKGDIIDEINQFQPDIVILIYTVRMLSDLKFDLQ